MGYILVVNKSKNQATKNKLKNQKQIFQLLGVGKLDHYVCLDSWEVFTFYYN